MNTPYRIKDITPTNASCADEYVGPDVDVVNAGRTSVIVVSGTSTDSAWPVPSTRNTRTWCRMAPTSKHRPTMPLHTIITVANTVSRAKMVAFVPPANI